MLESAKLLDQNRDLYCVPARPIELRTPDLVDEVVEPETVEPIAEVVSEGRGGSQHRDIQQLIKSLGHDFGFGVEVEASCKNSDGAIDVLLSGEKTIIAVEVSVTTSPEHELANLKKCLSENVDQVVCVSSDDSHRINTQSLCIDALPQSQMSRLNFLNQSSMSEFISQFDERETTPIRGYEVVTRTAKSDPSDVESRKSRIRQVLRMRTTGS